MLTTRDASGRSTCSVRRQSGRADGGQRLLRRAPGAELERRQRGEGRLGALVLVAPVGVQAVEPPPVAASYSGIAAVVVAEEPADAPVEVRRATTRCRSTRNARRSALGQGGDLDRLLVEAGPASPAPSRRPASAERWSVAGLLRDEPVAAGEPGVQRVVVAEAAPAAMSASASTALA